MLSEENLVLRRVVPISGEQLIYRFKDGHGLSVVNDPQLHSYPFAREIAVLEQVSLDGKQFQLTYNTPLTEDVEVFPDDESAEAFIQKARNLFEGGS